MALSSIISGLKTQLNNYVQNVQNQINSSGWNYGSYSSGGSSNTGTSNGYTTGKSYSGKSIGSVIDLPEAEVTVNNTPDTSNDGWFYADNNTGTNNTSNDGWNYADTGYSSSTYNQPSQSSYSDDYTYSAPTVKSGSQSTQQNTTPQEILSETNVEPIENNAQTEQQQTTNLQRSLLGQSAAEDNSVTKQISPLPELDKIFDEDAIQRSIRQTMNEVNEQNAAAQNIGNSGTDQALTDWAWRNNNQPSILDRIMNIGVSPAYGASDIPVDYGSPEKTSREPSYLEQRQNQTNALINALNPDDRFNPSISDFDEQQALQKIVDINNPQIVFGGAAQPAANLKYYDPNTPVEDQYDAQEIYNNRLQTVLENTPTEYRNASNPGLRDIIAKGTQSVVNRWNADKDADAWVGSHMPSDVAWEDIDSVRDNLYEQYYSGRENGLIPANYQLLGSDDVRNWMNTADQKVKDFFSGVLSPSQQMQEKYDAYERAGEAAINAGYELGSPEYYRYINENLPDYSQENNSTTSSENKQNLSNIVGWVNGEYSPGINKSTGGLTDNDLALEGAIRRGETTYNNIYNDYFDSHYGNLYNRYKERGYDDQTAMNKARESAQRLAYERIYHLGYRPDQNTPWEENPYLIRDVNGNLLLGNDVLALENTTGNDYYTNAASNDTRLINMLASGTDLRDDREFYDLASELAGNAYANQTKGTNYGTTPKITNLNNPGDPSSWNTALQAAMSGQLTKDQILHFYDSKDSDLVIPEETREWLASNSTHSLQQLFLNMGKNGGRLEMAEGTSEGYRKAYEALLNANPALKLMRDNNILSDADIEMNFFKGSKLSDSDSNKGSGYSGGGYGGSRSYIRGGGGGGGSRSYGSSSGSSSSGSSSSKQSQSRIHNIMKNWTF